MSPNGPFSEQLKLFYVWQMKELIGKSMLCKVSTLRLLFATEAYGMGADAPDVRRVIHITPPNSIESKYICTRG